MRILVYGSQEFGQVVKQLVIDGGLSCAGFIDDVFEGPEVVGPFAEAAHRFPPDEYAIVNAVGYRDLTARQRITRSICAHGYQMPSLIHRAAFVARTARIGAGCIIMAGALIDTGAVLRETVVAWPGAVVNHDAVIGDNTFLSPGCIVCGGAAVGKNCFVGAGAVIVDHAQVPDGTRIKANHTFA